MKDRNIQQGIYKHFKGNLYYIIGLAKHSETLQDLVVYKSIGNNKLWVRPLKMFREKLVVNGKEVLRFKYIGG